MLRTAEMDESDPRSTCLEHLHNVVIRSAAETSGTEADAIRGIVHHLQQRLDILLRTENTRQAENGARRIIRMDHHDAPRLLRHGNDFRKEMLQIGFQVFAGNRAVTGEHGADVFQRHAFESGKIVNDAAGQRVALFLRHGVVIRLGLFDHFRRIVVFRPFAFENEDFKRGKLFLIEK